MIESRATGTLSVITSRVPRERAEPTHSVWHVFTEVGTQVMTLGALEAALQRGDVSLATLVWIPGMVEWEPLGEVANLQRAALVAPSARRDSGVQSATRRSGDEPAHPICSCARSSARARPSAPRESASASAAKDTQARLERTLLDLAGERRWRRAAALLVALVLMLLGGWRLADAVAHQHQGFTAPLPAPPAATARVI